MKISMEILYRISREFNPVLFAKKSSSEMKYIGICNISYLTNPSDDYLLFGNADQFNSDITGKGLISIGKVSNYLTDYNDIICYPEDTDVEYLVKKLLSIFAMYDDWNNKMQYAIMKEKSLQYIVEISVPIFNNPILIHNMNFNILAYTEADYGRQMLSLDNENRPVINMDILNEFKIDKEYQKTLSIHGPAIFSEVMFGYRVLYINLWIDNQYYGRICIPELNREITDSDLYLLSFISDFVIHSFRLGYYTLSDKPRYLKNALHKIINGEVIEVQQLQTILINSGWNINDSFFCACLITDSRDIKTNTIKTTCQSLELHFPKTCVFNYDNNIIIIVNTTLDFKSIHDFSSKLGIFLREGLFNVGFSSIGKDFLNLKNYYIQAVAAYEIGSQKENSFWQFNFDDYVLSYIFRQVTQKLPKNLLSSGELVSLEQYDSLHQTDFYITLKTYLENNLNITKTSVYLNIHRTTLLYRLERITNIIKINLDDPKERFFLLWSFYLKEE